MEGVENDLSKIRDGIRSKKSDKSVAIKSRYDKDQNVQHTIKGTE